MIENIEMRKNIARYFINEKQYQLKQILFLIGTDAAEIKANMTKINNKKNQTSYINIYCTIIV